MSLTDSHSFPEKTSSSCSGGHRQKQESAKDVDNVRHYSLDQVFGFDDHVQDHVSAGKYDRAFTAMKRQMELGMELWWARQLVAFHRVCFMSRNSERADRVRATLADLIARRLPHVTAECAQEQARKMRDRELFPTSFLFYQLAAGMWARRGGREAGTGIANCCSGVRNAIKAFYAQRPAHHRALVQHHVIPLMREMEGRVRALEDVEPSFRTYCQAHCLHCVEYAEGHIRDYECCELTLVEAINLMEVRLSDESKRNRVFATLLHNLAYVYEVTGRLEAALKCYGKAIAADQCATDYRSERERSENVETARNSVRRIERKLRSEDGPRTRDPSHQQHHRVGFAREVW